jgi:hypothetical protein
MNFPKRILKQESKKHKKRGDSIKSLKKKLQKGRQIF